MTTDDLILSLAGDAPPVSRNAVERRMGLGLAAGAVVTFALVAALLGLRPDLPRAVFGFPFWMKWGYTISIALIAIGVTLHLARPEAVRPRGAWLLAVPAALLAALALAEVVRTPTDGWVSLVEGQSWTRCAALVASLSLPVFAGLIWAFRQLAPTRLRLTGAMAGMASGATAATLYGLHCPEATATFVLIWYSLGIAGAALLGTLAGPRFLRW